jgi:hypothetical protein
VSIGRATHRSREISNAPLRVEVQSLFATPGSFCHAREQGCTLAEQPQLGRRSNRVGSACLKFRLGHDESGVEILGNRRCNHQQPIACFKKFVRGHLHLTSAGTAFIAAEVEWDSAAFA